MIYGSVCSGIEAASVAWAPLGWRCAFVSEIEAFPSAVLAHHMPGVPNLGDFTTIGSDRAGIDLLVGGTPCQAFSVAGLRGGLADERGNLALEFCRLAQRLRPRWLVWENVPGVLSSGGGRDFGSFLGALAELGYGFAYRVLDAQHFGLAQRRKRVFVVACAGGQWQRAAAVLFERESLSGHPAPSREAGQDVAGPGACGSPGRGHRADLDTSGAFVVAPTLSDTLTSNPFTDCLMAHDGIHERCQTFVPVAFNARQDPIPSTRTTPPLDTDGSTVAVGVRRLTPTEWERLQGFPDGYTAIPYRGKPAADGPRYRAIGNSMAVPVMRWIGERIAAVEGAC